MPNIMFLAAGYLFNIQVTDQQNLTVTPPTAYFLGILPHPQIYTTLISHLNDLKVALTLFLMKCIWWLNPPNYHLQLLLLHYENWDTTAPMTPPVMLLRNPSTLMWLLNTPSSLTMPLHPNNQHHMQLDTTLLVPLSKLFSHPQSQRYFEPSLLCDSHFADQGVPEGWLELHHTPVRLEVYIIKYVNN